MTEDIAALVEQIEDTIFDILDMYTDWLLAEGYVNSGLHEWEKIGLAAEFWHRNYRKERA